MRLGGVDLPPGQVGGVTLDTVQTAPGVTLAFEVNESEWTKSV